jgi:hypothetical protein
VIVASERLASDVAGIAYATLLPFVGPEQLGEPCLKPELEQHGIYVTLESETPTSQPHHRVTYRLDIVSTLAILLTPISAGDKLLRELGIAQVVFREPGNINDILSF